MTRGERFDPGREADALTAEPPRTARRVRPNAASEHAVRLEAAIAARDSAMFPALIAEDGVAIDQSTGATYDRATSLAYLNSMLRTRQLVRRLELLATLDDSLALCRMTATGADAAGDQHDIGAFESEHVILIQADPQRRREHLETFPANRLGDAVVRLYERHAELLPAGSDRTRAAAIARGVAAATGPLDFDRVMAAVAPDIEYVDRRMFGVGPARGAEAFVRGARIRLEIASRVEIRIDDIVDLRSDALLVRVTNVGTVRPSGDAHQSQGFAIYEFGAFGRIACWERFDADAEEAALARFDELTGGRSRQRICVRPNAATACMAHLDAAIAARDADALRALLAEHAEIIDHTTGTAFDRQGMIESWRSLLLARDPVHEAAPLAVLGDSLALCRTTVSASGFTGGTIDVGPYRHEEIDLIEADAQGRCRRADLFGTGQLGDAIKTLFERHATLLPDGPERARASAIARSVDVVLEPPEPESIGAVLALDVQYADHRSLGWGFAHGVVPFIRALRTLLNALSQLEMRPDELIALRADALLVRRVVTGVLSDGGGPYRRRPIVLWAFGANGRVKHWEQFDGDQREKAIARFDALALPPTPIRLVENAATRLDDQIGRAEVLATRGDRLALVRMPFGASDGSRGPSDINFLSIVEVDRYGVRVAQFRFELGEIDAAYAELDARYAAGEGAAHPAMWTEVSSTRGALAAQDWDALVGLFAADLVAEDHRPLGFGVLHSPREYVTAVRAASDLRSDITLRVDHLLIGERAALIVANWAWREAGETFAIPGVVLFAAERGGRIDRAHHYSIEQLGDARAKFEELAAPPAPVRLLENLATRSLARYGRAWHARDWDGIVATLSPAFRYSDRRPLVHLELDRVQFLEFARPMFEMSSSRISSETLATRGDRLALLRSMTEVSDDAVGPSEIEFLGVAEVAADGTRVAHIRFDLGDLDAADAELDARYAAGEATAFPQVAETMRAFREAFARRDWEALAARMAPDVVVDDHRPLGWETVRGADAYIQTLHSLVELAPDTRLRLDHVDMSQRRLLWIGAWVGTRESGAFETPWITVSEHDARGVVLRFDRYDLDQLPAARARFAELRPDPLRIPHNAASRARVFDAFRAQGWEAVRALVADDFVFEDRCKRALVRGGVETWIESLRFLSTEAQADREMIGSAGDRIALERIVWTGAGFEIELILLTEVDAEGRLLASIRFDPDDRRAAFDEMGVRFATGEGAEAPRTLIGRAFNDHDWETHRDSFAPDAVVHDHRPLSLGVVTRDEYTQSARAWAEMAPDVGVEVLRIIAWNRHGRVFLSRAFGTVRDGGPFENFFVGLHLCDGDRIRHCELYPADAADAALARFAQLCAECE